MCVGAKADEVFLISSLFLKKREKKNLEDKKKVMSSDERRVCAVVGCGWIVITLLGGFLF